jgi:hypothetical protein
LADQDFQAVVVTLNAIVQLSQLSLKSFIKDQFNVSISQYPISHFAETIHVFNTFHVQEMLVSLSNFTVYGSTVLTISTPVKVTLILFSTGSKVQLLKSIHMLSPFVMAYLLE